MIVLNPHSMTEIGELVLNFQDREAAKLQQEVYTHMHGLALNTRFHTLKAKSTPN